MLALSARIQTLLRGHIYRGYTLFGGSALAGEGIAIYCWSDLILRLRLSTHPGKLLFNLSGEYIIMKTVICKGKCNYYGE